MKNNYFIIQKDENGKEVFFKLSPPMCTIRLVRVPESFKIMKAIMINRINYNISSDEIIDHNLPLDFNSLSKEEKLSIINDKKQNSVSLIEGEYYSRLKAQIIGLEPGFGI